MKHVNWTAVQESAGFERLPAGGYVCRIISVQDVPDKEYLLVRWDVEDGQYAHIGARAEELNGNDWSYIRDYRSYKTTAQGMFSYFLGVLEKSNANFTKAGFNDDEQSLVGLEAGLVLGAREYKKQNGTVGERLYVDKLITPQRIRDKDYTVPELQKLPDTPIVQQGTEVKDEEIPF